MSAQRLTAWRRPDLDWLPVGLTVGTCRPMTSRRDLSSRRVLFSTRSISWRTVHQTDFLGDVDNLRHVHYGYLIATLGQIDTLSVCHGVLYAQPVPTPC